MEPLGLLLKRFGFSRPVTRLYPWINAASEQPEMGPMTAMHFWPKAIHSGSKALQRYPGPLLHQAYPNSPFPIAVLVQAIAVRDSRLLPSLSPAA